MIYRDHGAEWIEEDRPTDDFPMARSNHAAEAQCPPVADAGGAGVVLRFGWFYGPGAKHSEEFLALARRCGLCIMMGRPTPMSARSTSRTAGERSSPLSPRRRDIQRRRR